MTPPKKRKIPQWTVSLPWHATVFRTVKARTREKAIELATELGHPNLCVQCCRDLAIDEFNDQGEIEAEKK